MPNHSVNDARCFKGLFIVSNSYIVTYNNDINAHMCINYKQESYFSELLQLLKYVSILIYFMGKFRCYKTCYMVSLTWPDLFLFAFGIEKKGLVTLP